MQIKTSGWIAIGTTIALCVGFITQNPGTNVIILGYVLAWVTTIFE